MVAFYFTLWCFNKIEGVFEMEENLVIVESPAKANTISNFLGKGFTVKSSFGHIRDLAKDNYGIDINNNYAPEYIVPDDKKKVVADLKKSAGKASMIWLASDEDREGEAIAWHLSEVLKLDPEKTRIGFVFRFQAHVPPHLSLLPSLHATGRFQEHVKSETQWFGPMKHSMGYKQGFYLKWVVRWCR